MFLSVKQTTKGLRMLVKGYYHTLPKDEGGKPRKEKEKKGDSWGGKESQENFYGEKKGAYRGGNQKKKRGKNNTK